MALGDGLVIFGSQYWGKKETEPVRKINAWAMRTGIFIALILFLLASFFSTQLLGLFTDQTIIEAGLSYLAIIRFTYFFFAVTQILLATLRCVEIAGIAFGLSVMTLVINCSINWILIYGHFGAPRMGAAGAAVGTLSCPYSGDLKLAKNFSPRNFRNFLYSWELFAACCFSLSVFRS